MLRTLRRLLPVAAVVGGLVAYAADPVDLAAPQPVAMYSPQAVLGQQVGVSIAAAAVSVPVALALGGWVGTLSGNILLSALPGLLVGTLLPPVAVTLAAWLTGNSVETNRFALLPSLLVTSGVSIAATIAAGILGLNANEPGRVALFAAAQSALLPAAAVGTMHFTAAPPTAGAMHVTLARIEF